MQPTIQMLTHQEIEQIDRTSRQVLEEIGTIVENRDALDIFQDAGAHVDFETKRVTIPSQLVDNALKHCEPMVYLYGRGDREPMSVGGENTYFGTTGFPTNLLDHKSGKYRSCTYEDLILSTRLADVLNPPDYILPNIGATDVPAEYVDLYEFKAAVTNTSKHIQAQAQNKQNLRKIVAMAEMLAGSTQALREKPFLSILVTLTSPLNLRPDSTELIIQGAVEGLPLFIESGPMAGATSPVTLASTLIMANAELLSSIVLAKQVNVNVPVIYASWARTLDMKTGSVCVGAPEFGMLRVATTQMAKFYNLPSGGGGTLTDSKWVDAQMGAELLSTALLPTLCGTNLIQGMGLLGGMNAASMETMVIANEITGYVRRIKNGIQVTEDTTSMDIFREVGPLGNFLTTQHTLENFQKEMWIPPGFDRSSVAAGEDETSAAYSKHIQDVIRDALATHRPPELPEDCSQRLDVIISGYGRP
jgi:trimethylamine--corrinoid protein Co-methyltransferase